MLGSALGEHGLAASRADDGLVGFMKLVNEEADAESPDGFDRTNALLAVRGDRESLSESERGPCAARDFDTGAGTRGRSSGA